MERSLCAGRVPYPPGLRRRERPPYGPRETRRPPGKMQPPRPLQTHVGDDARTAPAGAFRRPKTAGPALRPEIVPGCSRRCGVCGRGVPLPYMPSGNDRLNGIAAATRANVGRDALIPPGPAAAQGLRAGHAPPLHGIRARPAKWDCRSRPGERRAGCPHPADPAAGQGSAGGINPAPTGKFCVSGKSGGHDVCPGLQGRATALPQGSAAGQAGPIWNRPLHGVFAAAGMFPVLNFNGAAGVNARPTDPGKHGGHPGKCNPRGHCKPM